MESPLPYKDQDDELISRFNQLKIAIYRTDGNSSEEEIRALNELVQREVTANPILARIVQGNSSLLDACINLTTCQYEQFHPAIKFLIEANPSALLWQSYLGRRIIHNIAGHPSNCLLMPWIATNHQWVLNHEICLLGPPVFSLLHKYIRRGGTTSCTSAIIQQFFEAYPDGLTQVNDYGNTPLHDILMVEQAECEPDLFKWMAEQPPSNMLETNNAGWTPLHIACESLTRHRGYNSSEICKYLIEQCPESVQILDVDEWLPIHMLQQHCQHRAVKEVVLCLLREYPESYDMAVQTDDPMPAPGSIPFIQRIKSLLDEERELKENAAYLQDVAGVFRDAVNGTQTPSSLASSTCDAFVNWATLTSVQRLEAKMEHISMQLQQECNIDEEEDD